MMDIEEVSKEEFEQVSQGRGRVLSDESKAVLALDVGQAIKFPCRWPHVSPRLVCPGGVLVRHAAKRYDKVVTAKCINKVVWVLRIE